MNHISQRNVLTSLGKLVAISIAALVISSVLPVARLAHAATDPQGIGPTRPGVLVSASASVKPPFITGTFPFGYGGGPSKDVIPPKIQDLLANLRARLQSMIFGLFGSI